MDGAESNFIYVPRWSLIKSFPFLANCELNNLDDAFIPNIDDICLLNQNFISLHDVNDVTDNQVNFVVNNYNYALIMQKT